MLELSKNFMIPMNSKEDCDRINKERGTNFKSSDEHFDETIESIADMVRDCCESGGMYLGDHIEIEVKVKYCPEDK